MLSAKIFQPNLSNGLVFPANNFWKKFGHMYSFSSYKGKIKVKVAKIFNNSHFAFANGIHLFYLSYVCFKTI